MVTHLSLFSSNVIYETSSVIQDPSYHTIINPCPIYHTNINPFYNFMNLNSYNNYNYYNYITTNYGYHFSPIDPLILSGFDLPISSKVLLQSTGVH
jgi:hypothetical protein